MMSTCYWDEQLDYLLGNRMLAFNDDYLEFLVTRVWGFSEAVRVVDFGRGFGWLEIKLLPLPTAREAPAESIRRTGHRPLPRAAISCHILQGGRNDDRIWDEMTGLSAQASARQIIGTQVTVPHFSDAHTIRPFIEKPVTV